jgi:hypothetical protein
MLVATTVVAVLFLLTLGTPLVSADSITSTITIGNKKLAGLASPFGTVTVTVTGGVATVTFTAANSYLFGATRAVDLNLTQTGITASGFTFTGGNGKTKFTSAGSRNVSGFGKFNLTIRDFGGFKSAVSSVTFTLSGTWANAGSVLKINSKGYDIAAHIFANNGSKISGFAAEKFNPTVPDGGVTLMLLGGALVGIEALRRRLRV